MATSPASITTPESMAEMPLGRLRMGIRQPGMQGYNAALTPNPATINNPPKPTSGRS